MGRKAASRLEAIGVRPRLDGHFSRKLKVQCDAPLVAQMVRIAVEEQGMFEKTMPDNSSHSAPTQLYGKYQFPKTLHARHEHIEELRQEIEKNEVELEFYYSGEGQLVVVLGDLELKIDVKDPPENQLEAADKLERYFDLTRRLLYLLD